MKTERRRFPRTSLDRSAKLFHTPSLRYAEAKAIDHSAGGLLIDARMVRAILPGDPIRIAIDWQGTGLLSAESMLEARVVRAEPECDGVRRIALEFREPTEARVAA